MKKIFLLIAWLPASLYYSQVIYSNSFDNLSLQTYTTGNSVTLYNNVPAGFSVINDVWQNNPGTSSNPNRPFNVPALATTDWAVVYNAADNDTFMVSTSWLDTSQVMADRWVVTPAVSGTGITASSVLTWLAKSPDPNYADGYEVYVTTNLNASTPQDFTISDKLFSLPDGHTAGGGEKSTWYRRSIYLGSFAGQNLRFAFRNNSIDMYQLWIDDIQIINVGNITDGALSSNGPKKYMLAGTTDTVRMTLSNPGASNITYINASYQVGNGSINTENIVPPAGISYGQSAEVKFLLPYSISQTGYYTIKCWINSVNGVQDQNASNNTTESYVTVQSSSPAKTVLFEQFISANNGEGPDAQEKSLAIQSSSVIVVNVHDQDSIKGTNSAALIADYKSDFATGMADRAYFSDLQSVIIERPSYYGRTNTRALAVTPASVSIINKSYTPATRQLSFTVKADFVGEVQGDYRINAYLTENQVAGVYTDTTINGYNQWNNSYDVPWSPYYQIGYYSPVADTYILNRAQYKHQNALVYAFDGVYGTSGVISSTGGTEGQSYQKTFSLTIPTASAGINKFNADNLYIVGFVAEYDADKNKRSVLNAVKEKLNTNGEDVGIDEISLSTGLSLYPNPSTGIFYFNASPFGSRYQIRVFDMMGRCQQAKDVANDHAIEALDLSGLADGVYFLKINSGQNLFIQKILIQKGDN